MAMQLHHLHTDGPKPLYKKIAVDEYNRLRDENADLREKVATLEEAQRWRKVSEELPTAKDANESGKLLGYLGDYKIAHEYHWTDVRDKLYGITHWMPLPKFEEDK